MRFFVNIFFLLKYLTVLFYNMLKNNLPLLSQFLEKVSTNLGSTIKVNHADNLVKLGQKEFPKKHFQSEASSIYTNTNGKLIALR